MCPWLCIVSSSLEGKCANSRTCWIPQTHSRELTPTSWMTFHCVQHNWEKKWETTSTRIYVNLHKSRRSITRETTRLENYIRVDTATHIYMRTMQQSLSKLYLSSVYLSVYLPIHLIHMSVHPSIHSSIYLPIHLCVDLPVSLYVYLPIYLSS